MVGGQQHTTLREPLNLLRVAFFCLYLLAVPKRSALAAAEQCLPTVAGAYHSRR